MSIELHGVRRIATIGALSLLVLFVGLGGAAFAADFDADGFAPPADCDDLDGFIHPASSTSRT